MAEPPREDEAQQHQQQPAASSRRRRERKAGFGRSAQRMDYTAGANGDEHVDASATEHDAPIAERANGDSDE